MRDVGSGATVVQGDNNFIGLSAEAVQGLIEAATRGVSEKVAEVSRQLGVSQEAMRAVLRTVGEAAVPDEQLAEKLAEVVEQFRIAVAAIAALRPENAAAQEHVAIAAIAAASGNRNEAQHQLQMARLGALNQANQARQLAKEAEWAAAQQMFQAAQAAEAEAELVLSSLF